MNHTLLHRLAIAAGLLIALTATAGAAAEIEPSRLGTVRGDTLLVERDRLVALALAHNEMLRASEAQTEAAAARAAGAWSGFLPRISASETFMRTDDALGAFGFRLQNRGVGAADFDPTRLNAPGEINNWMTRLELQQPVFNGGMAWYGKRAADETSLAAAFDHARARETVELQAIEVFEGLTLALSYAEVMEAAIASAEANQRQAQSLVDAEMATEADLLQAKVFLSNLRQQLITVRNQVTMAGEMIQLLTTVETPLALVAAPCVDEVVPPTTVPAVEDVHQRHDLQARRHDAVAAASMVKVARGAMLPHLNLGLSRDLHSHDNAFGSDAKSWSMGVYATWDLFKGLDNISKLRQARADHRAANHHYAYELRRARHEVQQTWRDAEAAHARVDVARDAVTAARESLRIISNQYREGLASMVDLLDVQAAAIQAEGALVQARHDYRVDRARHDHASGHAAHEGGNQ